MFLFPVSFLSNSCGLLFPFCRELPLSCVEGYHSDSWWDGQLPAALLTSPSHPLPVSLCFSWPQLHTPLPSFWSSELKPHFQTRAPGVSKQSRRWGKCCKGRKLRLHSLTEVIRKVLPAPKHRAWRTRSKRVQVLSAT